jgi:hypothetical protein
MTATNNFVSGTSTHVLNVGQMCLVTVGERTLLRFSR